MNYKYLLLILGFIPLRVFAATQLIGVAPPCEQILISFNSDSRAIPKPGMDWTPLLNNLHRLGYPQPSTTEKLDSSRWRPQLVRQDIRRFIEKPNWDFGILTEKDSRLIGEHLDGYDANSLKALPYWNTLRGFNAPAAVNAYLKNDVSLDEAELTSLAVSVPLWVKGPLAFENAKLYFEKPKSDSASIDGTFVLRLLPQKLRPKFQKIVFQEFAARLSERRIAHENSGLTLAALSSLPHAKMSPPVRARINEQWLNLKKYPPVQLSGIDAVARAYHSAGNCPRMARGHAESLGISCENVHWKHTYIIRVKGVVVGSLKQTGDASMIALRNVYDEEGRLALAMGGVYSVGETLYRSIVKRPVEGRWTFVDVEQLQVHPISFLLNTESWEHGNMLSFINLIRDVVSKDELLELMTEMFKGADVGYQPGVRGQPRLHYLLWPQILESIERVRTQIETEN